MYEAHQYAPLGDGTVRCSLCAHRCRIADGKHGICGVRINRGGTLYAATFGRVAAEAIDPIEKKPLFHFLPGSTSYSLGGVGCNFRCRHCQNWEISQSSIDDLPLFEISPERGVERANAGGAASISWTYNEPTIWHEYPLEMGALAREQGLGTVYVTNGYITEEALAELAPMLNAFRVDIKAFSDEFYRSVCSARLQPVLDATVAAHEHGMHIETVTLVIPGLNDSMEEMRALISWVVENLGPDVPMHFTRFHPDYRMRDREPTPLRTIEKILQCARDLGIRYVYAGNVPPGDYENTFCPSCGALLIERSGFSGRIMGLEGDRCGDCGERIPVVRSV
ncbi:AmmeMemoRadiSam system radical SAM enzyme [Methanofollis fontis]|uniref:AmmeMemoRadiSam system radical SAM enzyme n=1 Tax=Methanofollis fontis TaxID=2052832 RepID=A0A483CU99_9EURY|nr:AmmeMemoRadiSam system radical SAM enzyme [Methanofollis fontis]TAJ44457.1 AmmeMemoRadiSam system radical SAM enzyme [Methanofollis fontis]